MKILANSSKKGIVLVSMLITLLLFAQIAFAATSESVKMNVVAPSQAKPGETLRIAISILNLNEGTEINATEQAIQQSEALYKSASDQKNNITINEIDFEIPIQAINAKTADSFFKKEKMVLNENLLPSGTALMLRKNLRKEFRDKTSAENLTVEQIKAYADQETQLNELIAKGRHTELIEIPVPPDVAEGTTLNIPINVSYTDSTGEVTSLAHQTSVKVTSNPVPKKAVVIIVDAARADMMYNTVSDGLAGNISTLLDNGVKFTEAKTIFPSVTPPGHSAILTGAYPANNGIVGFTWFNKSTQEFVSYGSKVDMFFPPPRVNQDLNTQTIFEEYNADDPCELPRSELRGVH